MAFAKVEIGNGTASCVIRSTADGLASGYQRTATSTAGISVLEDTSGLMLIPVFSLPKYIDIEVPPIDIFGQTPLKMPPHERDDELAEGYKAQFSESAQLAEELLPFALEVWAEWDE